MTMLRWWSESQRAFVLLTDMHASHLRWAYGKLMRGQYVPGNESQADPLTAQERDELEVAFLAEFARRGFDEEGNPPLAPQSESAQ